MIIAWGTALFGRVDHLPGTGYVATQFFHFNCLPLMPVQSYLVFEGTERGGRFAGVPIPLYGRSVVAGYLWAWLGLAFLLAGLVAAGSVLAYLGRTPGAPEGVKALTVFTLGAAIVALFLRPKLAWTLQVAVHVLSAIAMMMIAANDAKTGAPAPWLLVGVLIAANVILLAYGLVRLLEFPGSRRRKELLRRFGMETAPGGLLAEDEGW